MNNTKEFKIEYTNATTKYYTHYKKEALKMLDGDTSINNIEKQERLLIEQYSSINPFDDTLYIEGIPRDATDLFSNNKKTLYFQLHKNIIKDVFSDIKNKQTEEDLSSKSISIDLDTNEINSQIKYLKLVIKALQSKLKTNLLSSIKKLIKNTNSTILDEIMNETLEKVSENFDINFNTDEKALNFILKFNLDTLVKDYEDKIVELRKTVETENISPEEKEEIEKELKNLRELLFILPGRIKKLKNSIMTELTSFTHKHRNIEHIFKITNIEINDFDINNPDIAPFLGLGGFVDQLSKFSKVIDKEDIKISTNFFNIEHYSEDVNFKAKSYRDYIGKSLFYTSFSYLDGWGLEELFTIMLKGEKYNNDTEIKKIDPDDWNRLHHFKSMAKTFFLEKSFLLKKQMEIHEELGNTENLSQLKNALEYLNENESLLMKKLMNTFLSSNREDLFSNLEKTLSTWDEKLSLNPILNVGDLFINDDVKLLNTLKMTMKKKLDFFLQKTNNINLKLKKGAQWNDLNNYERRTMKNYNEFKNEATVDAISFSPSEDNSECELKNVYEIKSLTPQNGKLTFNMHFEAKYKNSKDFENILNNDIDYLKTNQPKITNEERCRLDSLGDFGIDKSSTFLSVNIIDGFTQKVESFEIPFNAWNDFLLNEHLFDNARIEERDGYKHKLSVDIDFFIQTFNEYSLDNRQETDKKVKNTIS